MDSLIRGSSTDGNIRVFTAITTDTVEEAHRIHQTSATASAALGRLLTAAAILGAFLLATIGLILGTVYASAIIEALSAVIVLAVSLFVMLITVVVIGICKCNR